MAFDASKPDEAGPVGTFDMPTDGQILSCPDGANVSLIFTARVPASFISQANNLGYAEYYFSQRQQFSQEECAG